MLQGVDGKYITAFPLKDMYSPRDFRVDSSVGMTVLYLVYFLIQILLSMIKMSPSKKLVRVMFYIETQLFWWMTFRSVCEGNGEENPAYVFKLLGRDKIR